MEYVIILTHTQIEYDSRIRRQINLLSKKYGVILCCKKGNGENLKFLPSNIQYFFYDELLCHLSKRLLEVFIDQKPDVLSFMTEFNSKLQLNISAFTAYENYRIDLLYAYKRIYEFIKKNNIKVKLIIANDVFVLPMAIRLKNIALVTNPNVKLLGDMHEVHFDYLENQEDSNQKVRTWLCDNFLRKCDLISSVSDWGAQIYSQRYKKTPVLSIRNVAEYHDLNIKKTDGAIRLVNVGNAQRARRIEDMINLMELLDSRFVLDFYLVSNNEVATNYIKELNELIKLKGLQDRVRILEPVVSEQLVETIHQYDIGIFYLVPIVSNHKYILPNKLFEFIQGRVAVVTTPVLSMKEIIEQHEVGRVSSEYSLESFAWEVTQVAHQLDFYKEKSNQAAKLLNAEKEWNVIMRYIE